MEHAGVGRKESRCHNSHWLFAPQPQLALSSAPPGSGYNNCVCEQGPVTALCDAAGVDLLSNYDSMSKKEVDLAFICTKTYSLAAVAAEMAKAGVVPKVVVLIHNGIFKSPFTVPSVAVVVPQGYDFVETKDTASGWTIHVRNEEKPWIMPNTPDAVRVAKFLNNAKVLAVVRAQEKGPWSLPPHRPTRTPQLRVRRSPLSPP